MTPEVTSDVMLPRPDPFRSHPFDFKPVIRPMRREDASAVSAMIADLAAHHGDKATATPDDLLRDVFGPTPWVRVLVCESDGGLMGYGVMHALYRAQAGTRGMEVQHLYVCPSWRGKGVGKRLIEAIMDAARTEGCGYVNVGTLEDNLQAQSFYLHLGFEATPRLGLRFRMPVPEFTV